jgi:hypothetical protein
LDLRSCLRVGFAALALSVGLAACSSGVARDPFHPRFLSGEDAAKRIDVSFGGSLVADYPSITVGRARCPFLNDLSGGHAARCTLPVTGGVMRVDVGVSAAPNGVRSPDTLIVRSEAEPRIAAKLARPGERIAVRCPGPAVRVVPNDTTIHCAFTGGGVTNGFVRVEFGTGDELYVFGSKKTDVDVDALFQRAVITQSASRIVLDGPQLEVYLRAEAGGTARDELERRHLIGKARCPPQITLTPGVHAACTVRLGTANLRLDLRFDQGRGMVVDFGPTVEIVAAVRERAERFFAHILPIVDPGLPLMVRIRVDCGSATVALLEPGEAVPCTAYAGKQVFPFAAQLLESGGSVTFVRRYPRE